MPIGVARCSAVCQQERLQYRVPALKEQADLLSRTPPFFTSSSGWRPKRRSAGIVARTRPNQTRRKAKVGLSQEAQNMQTTRLKKHVFNIGSTDGVHFSVEIARHVPGKIISEMKIPRNARVQLSSDGDLYENTRKCMVSTLKR